MISATPLGFTQSWLGVPLPRLQKLLGHKTPAMSLRYARHAPEPHGQDDAARIAASITGVADREAQAVRALKLEPSGHNWGHSALEHRAVS